MSQNGHWYHRRRRTAIGAVSAGSEFSPDGSACATPECCDLRAASNPSQSGSPVVDSLTALAGPGSVGCTRVSGRSGYRESGARRFVADFGGSGFCISSVAARSAAAGSNLTCGGSPGVCCSCWGCGAPIDPCLPGGSNFWVTGKIGGSRTAVEFGLALLVDGFCFSFTNSAPLQSSNSLR